MLLKDGIICILRGITENKKLVLARVRKNCRTQMCGRSWCFQQGQESQYVIATARGRRVKQRLARPQEGYVELTQDTA